nr:PadR family transcriptional regulator [Maliibacterium massiliense]
MTFQLGSTLLDACVLSVLHRGDSYGYLLTQNLRDVVRVSESTLYPVLRRLQKEGFLATYDQPFQGRNRRYYTITAQGRAQYMHYVQQWSAYKDMVDKIMLGGADDDKA